jgi:asparagine synthase (glutamine-hydrolysing)
MCGIAGVVHFNKNSEKINDALLTEIRDAMVHRGPDGGENWISNDGKVGFAHRRLSIIDLTTVANQPMSNENGRLWVVFNGEIYNHSDIRAELKQLGGHEWKTDHSDTEVILHAYEQWGIDFVHKLRGMFAIALWDDTKRELLLIRDRIGVKPFYYTINNNKIIFASEIKAILKDPSVKRKVNEEAFFHYLSFMASPAPNTIFEGIKKIPPGTWLKISENGEVTEKRYWDIWDNAGKIKFKNEEDIAEQILQELKTSVKLRKVSDVPVGVFLSGGIDSSTNTKLFSEGEGMPVKAFSIGYQGKYDSYKNEVEYARSMAEYAGAEYYEKLLTIDDLIDFLPLMVHLQDEPIADPVCVPVYYVSKLARENGVIVCQVGEGADELFWGYPTWKTKWKLQKLADKVPFRFVKKIAMKIFEFVGKDQWHDYEALRRSANGQPIFWGGADIFTDKAKKKILSKRLKEKFKNVTSWDAIKPIYDRYNANAWEKSTLNWMSYLDLNLRLPELLLMRVDKMGMGASLEGRVPFLDHKFVELSMSIPESIKVKNGTLKYILKKAVRGVIPDEIIDRKKQGFGVPVYEWLMDKLGDTAKKEVFEFCDETDFLDKKEVEKLFESNQGTLIWVILNFVLWWKHYIKDVPEFKKDYLIKTKIN